MTDFAQKILDWYAQNARILPWRNHPDPYAVWVSEIMLQQTQVATVIPYFTRWLERFPTVHALASASEQDVLTLWEGLGYYSRARNLHRAARIVVEKYGGKFPSHPNELFKLPGIGRYTAAAIASMAFGVDIATLDGNLRRVFARVFNVSLPADTPAGENVLWKLAEEHLPGGRAGDYNQALMDLGATICLPKNPLCLLCPLADLCESRSLGIQEQRPVMRPKPAVPTRIKFAAVIVRDGNVLMAQRPSKGLLGGLWEFPASQVDADSPEDLPAAIEADYRLKVSPVSPLGTVRHAYTHFKLIEHAYLCNIVSETGNENYKWICCTELGKYPMGKVDRQISYLLKSFAKADLKDICLS